MEWLIAGISICAAASSYYTYIVTTRVAMERAYEVRLNNCIAMLHTEEKRKREYTIPDVATYLDLRMSDVHRFLEEKDARVHATYTDAHTNMFGNLYEN